MKKINVAVIEDHSIFRKRMSELLSFYEEVSLNFAVENAEQCIKNLDKAEVRPDVLLMDIELPGLSGIEATFQIKQSYPEIDIIMFTVFEDDERIFESIQVGATGYLLKDEPIENVVRSIREVKKGGAPISPGIARKMLGLMTSMEKGAALETEEMKAVPFDLTPAEIRILEQVVDGKTNKEIAEQVFLSPWTVKTHIKNIYKKMQVNSRAAAVRLALRRKVV
ncbi:response regulator [Gracilimonas tropica]|uniref:response regulator n=1 Tax=Gracilimonas tropica TaxID=454600 RepID=UPI0003727DA8|nr:response regulator transcription factor [Gracilimonas tropica]